MSSKKVGENLRTISSFSVDSLFGTWEHSLKARPDEPTIITAPNGAGKTHVLALISATLRLDAESLLNMPYGELTLTFTDGRGLKVIKVESEDSESTVKFQAQSENKDWGAPLEVLESEVGNNEEELPPSIKQLKDGRWYDYKYQRFYTPSYLERRYRVKLNVSSRARFSDHPEILAVVDGVSPVLIDTKRLDIPMVHAPDNVYSSYRRSSGDARMDGDPRGSSYAASSIGQYVEQIKMQISDARRQSVSATQSADLSFARRALVAKTVKEEQLRKRYNEIAKNFAALTRNALATGAAPLEFPEKTTPTDRRILNVFLDDWQKRLDPLLPINAKITALRQVLDSKLAGSGKQTRISSTGSLGFKFSDDRIVRVSSLSSGEQHLVALFTLLLFSTEPGSIILIDEPEISMHAAWKHSFLQDVTEVAEIGEFQVIIATHSTSIINGRWDLVEELAFPSISPGSPNEGMAESGDSEEWDIE